MPVVHRGRFCFCFISVLFQLGGHLLSDGSLIRRLCSTVSTHWFVILLIVIIQKEQSQSLAASWGGKIDLCMQVV
jgi:hypothetical protein